MNSVLQDIWLRFTVSEGTSNTNTISKDDKTPLVVVVPGLTSDSDSAVSC